MRSFEKPDRDDLDHIEEAVSLITDDEIEMRLALLLLLYYRS